MHTKPNQSTNQSMHQLKVLLGTESRAVVPKRLLTGYRGMAKHHSEPRETHTCRILQNIATNFRETTSPLGQGLLLTLISALFILVLKFYDSCSGITCHQKQRTLNRTVAHGFPAVA